MFCSGAADEVPRRPSVVAAMISCRNVISRIGSSAFWKNGKFVIIYLYTCEPVWYQ